MYLSVRLSAAASVSVTVYTCNYNALLKATTIAQACKQADTQTDIQRGTEKNTVGQTDRHTEKTDSTHTQLACQINFIQFKCNLTPFHLLRSTTIEIQVHKYLPDTLWQVQVPA